MSSYRVAVDVGGTFMDFVLLDEATGEVRIEKVPSLPDQLHTQFALGLKRLDVEIDDIRQIFHGFTVGLNALVQERGAKVGLITTRGFRDVLEMGRGGRKPVYDFVQLVPTPMVPRRLRREVTERATFDGAMLEPLNLKELDGEIEFLLSEGVEAIAIAFLHAYAFPDHELAARDHILERYPGLKLSVSHLIAAEWREYERTATTVSNAFIQPVVKTYLDNLQDELSRVGYKHPLAIMQSSGGVVDSAMAGEKPIRTLMSGPAGGVMGAKFLCDRLGHKNVICTDVGGTTYDVAIIEDGRILERSQTEVNGRPVLGSIIDVVSIGAGGGSIAWLDHRGGLQVGPRSAGASPGPVCFGRGGTEPTVTDAHLMLGRLDADYFLGGRMKLDMGSARKALSETICEPLSLDLTAAAEGIVAIAETNMANAIRTKTVERGLDPREFVMMAFGGGGGLFACSVAEELGVEKVIVPVAPANFSAWGILTTDYSEDEVRTRVMPFEGGNVAEALTIAEELLANASAAIERYGFARAQVERTRRFDIRYVGQEYTIPVAANADWTVPESVEQGVRELFVAAHQQLYGHGEADAPLELVSIRCRATGRVQPPLLAAPRAAETTESRARSVYFSTIKGWTDTPVYARTALEPGKVIGGPLIVDEWTMTTIVPPGWQCVMDEFGNLILTPAIQETVA